MDFRYHRISATTLSRAHAMLQAIVLSAGHSWPDSAEKPLRRHIWNANQAGSIRLRPYGWAMVLIGSLVFATKRYAWLFA